jgi:hypothetical protein
MVNLTLPLERPLERLRLQTLIESARFDVFGDYDMFESIETRAVTIHQDGFLRRIGLREPEALFQLQPILEDAVTMIEAVGGRFGYALVYVKENGRELVFLAAINETEKGICTLELKRRTGDPPRDLLPLSSDANCAFLEGLDWGGSRHKVDVEITDQIWI